MEHSYTCDEDVMCISHLLYGENQWAGKRIVWAGDYGKGIFESEFPDNIRYRREFEDDEYEYPLHSIAYNWFEELGLDNDYDIPYEVRLSNLEETRKTIINSGAKDIRYYVNEDRKEYVDLTHAKRGYREGIYVHPLPILCSYGCGEGGGDYFTAENHPSAPFIGLWAGHRIRAYKEGEEDSLTGYQLITPGFTEEG